MPYSQVKVYSDGGHFIGVPYEPNPRVKNRRPRCEEIIEIKEPLTADIETVLNDEQESVAWEQNSADVQEKSAPPAVRQMTRKELFDELYMQTVDMKKRERKSYIVKQMLPYFDDGSSCRAFVEQNFERKHRNMICRRTRLWRKINHQRFNYFVTFTYADDKMTEEQFAKSCSTPCIISPTERAGCISVHGNAAGKQIVCTFTGCSISRKVPCQARWKFSATSIPVKGECGRCSRIRFLPRGSDGMSSVLFTMLRRCRRR